MHTLTLVLLALAGQTVHSPTAADPAYAPLRAYEGTWQVTRKDVANKDQPAGAKPETLVNQCSLLGKYFACSQTINGSQGGLVVFIPAGKPGHFWTQTIMPEGRATGRDDLEIAGDQVTYLSRRDQDGKTTFFRTTNKFTDKNHIHFEQAQSNNGTDWKTGNTGDEVRAGASTKR